MKLVMTIVGALAALLGCVWILQGLNVLPGSFMTGDIKWAIYGGLLALVGVAVIVWARRRPAYAPRRRSRSSSTWIAFSRLSPSST